MSNVSSISQNLPAAVAAPRGLGPARPCFSREQAFVIAVGSCTVAGLSGAAALPAALRLPALPAFRGHPVTRSYYAIPFAAVDGAVFGAIHHDRGEGAAYGPQRPATVLDCAAATVGLSAVGAAANVALGALLGLGIKYAPALYAAAHGTVATSQAVAGVLGGLTAVAAGTAGAAASAALVGLLLVAALGVGIATALASDRLLHPSVRRDSAAPQA